MAKEQPLRVHNLTQNVVLVENGRVANPLWRRMKGLMGIRQLEPGDGLLISPCNSVHTQFMHIPIDVIFVSEQDEVIDIASTNEDLAFWSSPFQSQLRD